MKRISDAFRLLLPVAAIILLVLHLMGKGGESRLLLIGGLLCSSTGIWLNSWCQRRERRKNDE